MEQHEHPRLAHHKRTILYDLALVLLAFGSTGLVLFEITHEVTPEELRFLSIIDLVIAGVFAYDFAYGWLKAQDKKQFWKTRWYEVFACIPLTNTLTETLRGLRILQIMRVARTMARIRRIGDVVFDGLSFRLFSLGITVATLLFLSAIAFYSVEYGHNPGIKGFFDSLWWAISTLTTTGYGDIYPVTTVGRIIAMFLMVVGFSTLGVATATIASSVYQSKEEADTQSEK